MQIQGPSNKWMEEAASSSAPFLRAHLPTCASYTPKFSETLLPLRPRCHLNSYHTPQTKHLSRFLNQILNSLSEQGCSRGCCTGGIMSAANRFSPPTFCLHHFPIFYTHLNHIASYPLTKKTAYTAEPPKIGRQNSSVLLLALLCLHDSYLTQMCRKKDGD